MIMTGDSPPAIDRPSPSPGPCTPSRRFPTKVDQAFRGPGDGGGFFFRSRAATRGLHAGELEGLGRYRDMRYVEVLSNRLVLRPCSSSFLLELLEVEPGESPKDLLTGRVALILNQP